MLMQWRRFPCLWRV